jgi:hypothetical protein
MQPSRATGLQASAPDLATGSVSMLAKCIKYPLSETPRFSNSDSNALAEAESRAQVR